MFEIIFVCYLVLFPIWLFAWISECLYIRMCATVDPWIRVFGIELLRHLLNV